MTKQPLSTSSAQHKIQFKGLQKYRNQRQTLCTSYLVVLNERGLQHSSL